MGWLPAAIRHARERELHRRTRARLLRWRAQALAAHAEVSRLVGCELDEGLALDAVIRAGESECGNYHEERAG
ncbi:MAG: hypothetical protein IT200_17075 [Thermoleophilia bacterium]|nr:hypothetical protein [Thermoleophilia bacterium]